MLRMQPKLRPTRDGELEVHEHDMSGRRNAEYKWLAGLGEQARSEDFLLSIRPYLDKNSEGEWQMPHASVAERAKIVQEKLNQLTGTDANPNQQASESEYMWCARTRRDDVTYLSCRMHEMPAHAADCEHCCSVAYCTGCGRSKALSQCLCALTPVLKCKACVVDGVRDDASVCAALAKHLAWGQLSQSELDALIEPRGVWAVRSRLTYLCELEHNDRVVELLNEFRKPAMQGEDSLALEQRLARLQNSLDLKDWADGGAICAKSYLFHTFGFSFDHKSFKWSHGCNQWCNEPRLTVIIPISDTLKNIKWVQGIVISGWLMLDEPITLKDGTTLHFRIRWFCGDAPLQQRRHGVNTGNAHYRCWLCDEHTRGFVDLTAWAEQCNLRDLSDLSKSAARAGCTHGGDTVNPRGIAIKALRKLIKSLKIMDPTGKKRACLENALIDYLKGVNSRPGLLGDEDATIEDISAIAAAEGAPDFALHVLKGVLGALRKIIKDRLDPADRVRWNRQENIVDGGKEEYSGQDYRKWVYASPFLWRAVESRSNILTNLENAMTNIAHATKYCFRQGYPGWHSEHGKMVLRAISYIYKFSFYLQKAVPTTKVRVRARARGRAGASAGARACVRVCKCRCECGCGCGCGCECARARASARDRASERARATERASERERARGRASERA